MSVRPHPRTTILALAAALVAGGGARVTAGPMAELDADCTLDGKKLLGRVKVVEHFEDFAVRKVDHFPDLRVDFVDHFPDTCGRWQLVDSFPDFTIRYVDHFPDLEIEVVDSFPGVP